MICCDSASYTQTLSQGIEIMSYGLPYCGSKSRIAEWIMGFIPKCECFVDVFAGGCAITHAAMEYRKANRYIVNDISGVPQFFLDAINGKYHNESRWISHEDFDRLKDEDPYVACCWSFGNHKEKGYLYSREIEPYKKACHYAIVFDEWEQLAQLCPEICEFVKHRVQLCRNRHDRRIVFGQSAIMQLKRISGGKAKHPVITNNPLYASYYTNTNLQSLERLERLQSLQRQNKDYRELEIPKDAFIYCDPPYKDSGCDYNVEFNHDEFCNWCVDVAKTNQILISEYNIDDPRFECVGEKEKLVTMASTKSMLKTERLYTVKK